MHSSAAAHPSSRASTAGPIHGVDYYDDEDDSYDDDEYPAVSREGSGAEKELPPLCAAVCDFVIFCCCAESANFADESPLKSFLVFICTLGITMGIIAGIVVMASRGKGPIIRNDAGALGSPERNFAHTPRWVDVVYTWVNGSHPTAELQLEAAIKADVLPYRPHSSRFRDDGLFEFALRSLLVADGLMRSVRNVYIVTSGEIPSFLPVQRLHPVGAHDTNSTGDDRGGSASCHVQDGFTTTTLSMPLRPLIEASGGSTARHGGGMNRKLFIVPHSALFPAPAEELPTFNSNSILAVIHRIPRLGRWFLYSDDDCIINNKNVSMSAWWDAEHAAQKLYFTPGQNIHRRRPYLRNNWEEAMSYMSSLLDRVGSSPPPPPFRSPPPPPPGMHPAPPTPRHTPPTFAARVWPPVPPCPGKGGPANATATARTTPRTVQSQLLAVRQRNFHGLVRHYSRPQHMPVLFSRSLIEELELRWAREFARTRRNRLRLGDEIELNFLYHHYLRVSRFPVQTVPSSRKLLESHHSDFVTFNDDATKMSTLESGLVVLHRLLREQFGTFSTTT
jgi:hypothetical protein